MLSHYWFRDLSRALQSPLQIKKLTAEDTNKFQDFIKETATDFAQNFRTNKSTEASYKINTITFILIYHKSIIGYAQIHDGKDKSILYLERLFVKSSYRNNGYGKMLLEKCCESARENNKVELQISLVPDHCDQGFFKNLGFTTKSVHAANIPRLVLTHININELFRTLNQPKTATLNNKCIF